MSGTRRERDPVMDVGKTAEHDRFLETTREKLKTSGYEGRKEARERLLARFSVPDKDLDDLNRAKTLQVLIKHAHLPAAELRLHVEQLIEVCKMLQQEFSDSPNEAVGEEGEKRKWVSDIRGQVEAILYHLEVAGRREERHRKREERDDMLDEQRNRVDDWLESITVSGADPNSSG